MMAHQPSSPTGRRTALVLLALLFAAFYGRYVIGFTPSGGDLVNQYLPYQELVRNAVRHGEAPLWNAMTFCGRPLMADIQVGVLYPPNWLHWLLPLPLSFALLLALHGAWMIAGCWRLGRHWRLEPTATVLGAVLFCAAAFFTLKSAQGIVLFIYVGAWWPWLALGVSRLIERPGIGRAATLAGALALSLLAGSPQITYFGWLMTVAVGLALPAGADNEDTPASPLGRWLRRLPWIALPFILALGLTAIQTAQTSSFIGSSFERGGAGAGWDYVTNGSLEPRMLWLLINPGFLGVGHDPVLYWGSQMDFAESCYYAPLWVATLLLPLALVARWRPAAASDAARAHVIQRRLALLSLTAMVLGLGLALGRFSPLFKLFYLIVPAFNRFRVPARLMLFFTSGEALLAALTLNALLRHGVRSRRAARVMLAAGLLAGLGLVWGALAFNMPLWRALNNPFLNPGLPHADIFLAALTRHAMLVGVVATLGLLGAAAILAAILATPESGQSSRAGGLRGGWPWALALLALAELTLLAWPLQKSTPISRFQQEIYPTTPVVQALQREHRGGRILWLDDVNDWHYDQNQPELYPNRPIMYGIADARGYDPVNARWLGNWMNLLGNRNPNENPGGLMFVPEIARPAWLTLMGVESVLSYNNLGAVAGLRPVASFDFPPDPAIPGAPSGKLQLWRNERFRGMAYAAPMPKLARDSLSALYASATAAEKPVAPPEATIVTDDTFLQGVTPQTPIAKKIDGRFRVTPQTPGTHRFEYAVDYPEPALLCLAQSAYGGWEARIDGEPTPISTLASTFLATLVPAGRHTVVFDFVPEGLALGKLISLLTLVALAYGLTRARLKRKSGKI